MCGIFCSFLTQGTQRLWAGLNLYCDNPTGTSVGVMGVDYVALLASFFVARLDGDESPTSEVGGFALGALAWFVEVGFLGATSYDGLAS